MAFATCKVTGEDKNLELLLESFAELTLNEIDLQIPVCADL